MIWLKATNTAGNLYVSDLWFIYFLAFDFMQDMTAIRSNDNLDHDEGCVGETHTLCVILAQ